MKPVALVATTVHWPDDTRIRERLIRTLADDFSVVYAAKAPGPSDRSGMEYVALEGGRIRRNLQLLRVALSRQWDLLVLHDPETIPLGIVMRLVRGGAVVFDVHEDYRALVQTRNWVPQMMRRPLSWLVALVLAVAERMLVLTLAEPGYRDSFKEEHPVFVNYPDTSRYPTPQVDRAHEVVYLGDATIERGVDIAAAACAQAGIPFVVIGQPSPELEELGELAEVSMEGRLPNPDALRRVARASVGLSPLHDLPNYRNSQPTKILEYLALGVPVVASDLPGTRDLVAGLAAVELVPPGDPDSLASAINRMLSVDVRMAAIEQAPSIRASHRWPSAEVLEFYRSLL